MARKVPDQGGTQPTYFGGTPTSVSGYAPPPPAITKYAEEDFSPEVAAARERDRYIAEQYGEQGLSTQAAPSLGLGAQFTYPQNQYSGPFGAGVPQVAVSRYSGAEAVVRAGLTSQRATTLQAYPQLVATLVNAGLVRPTEQFPEGVPQQAINVARTGVVPTAVTDRDVARLLNVAELDLAARRFLMASDDPIRQANILSSMDDIQKFALYDTIQGLVERQKEFASSGDMQVVSWVGTALAYPADALWWLNRQVIHAASANMNALKSMANVSPLAAAGMAATMLTPNPMGGVAYTRNVIDNWDKTVPGQFDQQALDVLRQEHGSKTVDVLAAFATAQAKLQEQYVWDTTSVNWGLFPTFEAKLQSTPLMSVMMQFQDDPEALNIIRQLVYAPAENPDFMRAARGVDAAANWNLGQQLANLLPLDPQGIPQEQLANAANVVIPLIADPTLGAAKVVRAGRILRYSIFRLAPGVENVDKALAVPGVRRSFTEAIRFMERYRTILAEDPGRAAILRNAWSEGNKDLDPILDDMLKWNNGAGVRSMDDVRTMIMDSNDLERVLAGNPAARVASEPTIWEKLYTSAANSARRDPLMPRMSSVGAARNRVRQSLAINGLGARRGQRMAREMFGTSDPSVIAQTMADASEAIGSKFGMVEREIRNPLAEAVGLISKRRPTRASGKQDESALVGDIPAVDEKNPGKFRRADMSWAARWDRATRLLSKKPNGGLINTADARDAHKIYILARAFFPKYLALLLEDAYIRGSQADRVLLHNGIVRTAAEATGVRLRYGNLVGGEIINNMAAGGTARFERYSPTIIKRVKPDGSVVYKVYDEKYLENGAFPLALRKEGEEFANPAEMFDNAPQSPKPSSNASSPDVESAVDEFSRTGEELLHGTTRNFDTFEGGAKNRYGRPSNGIFYFTDKEDVANRFGPNRSIATLSPEDLGDNLLESYDLSEYQALDAAGKASMDAQLRADVLDMLGSKGAKEFRLIDDNGEYTIPATIDDLTVDRLYEYEFARVVAPDARVVRAKVYGKTLDLAPPRPPTGRSWTKADDDRLKAWYDAKSSEEKQLLADRFDITEDSFNQYYGDAIVRKLVNWGASFSHESDVRLHNWMRDNGYGKARVVDAYESGGQSVLVLPEMIAYGRNDPIANFRASLNGGKESTAGTVAVPAPSDVELGSGGTPPPPPTGGRVPPDAVPPPDDATVIINPSVVNGREHPLHLYQASDWVRTPDYVKFQQIQQRGGFWGSFFGWADSNPATRLTDAWSLATLIGPRFVARSGLEDYAMWLMTDGSWTDFYRGRRVGTRLRAWRDMGQRADRSVKFEAGQPTWFGRGSRLGIINRHLKPRDEALREEATTNNSYGRFILDHLTTDEREALNASRRKMATALDERDTIAARSAAKEARGLLARALFRAHGVSIGKLTDLQARVLSNFGTDGVIQSMMDDILEQATFYNSARTPTAADATINSMMGAADITMGRIRYADQYVDLNLANGEAGSYAAWHHGIYGTINHDGPIGIIAVANLPKYVNPRTRAEVIGKIVDALRNDTKWGYKERLSIFSEKGFTVEDYAQRYLDEVLNLFSKGDGSLNYDLWRKVVVRESDTTFADRLTIADRVEEAASEAPRINPSALRNLPPEWRQIDFYDVLRVPRDASQETIRRAYRQRARETHPDVNSDPMAAQQFGRVQMAYEVLSDEANRKLYDAATTRLMPTGGETFVGSVRVPTTSTRIRVTTDNLSAADLRGYKSPDLPQFVVGPKRVPIPSVTSMGRMDEAWQILGAQYNRVSKEPIFLANVLAETEKLQPYYDELATHIGPQAAEARVAKLAVDRATQLTLSYTDNPANRTLLAWNLRNAARYYRATEDFIRRMLRVTKNYPEGIWKIALTYDVLDDSGWVWTNDNGEKYFMYPGTGFLTQKIANIIGNLRGYAMPEMNLFDFGGKVTMLMPSSDPNQMLPSLTGPVGVLLPSLIKSFTPEFDGLEKAILGEYGADADLWQQLIPTSVQRVMSAFNQDERLSAYGNVTKAAMQIAVAAGLEPHDPVTGEALLDESAQREFQNSISLIAQSLLLMKMALGFIVPASPQLIPQDVTLYGRRMGAIGMNPVFRQLIDEHGDDPYAFEKALVQGYKTFGPSFMPVTVSQTEVPDGMSGLINVAAANAYSRDALVWAKNNRKVVTDFPIAATYLFPRDNKFDITMYSWWKTNGYKTTSDFDTFFQRLASAKSMFEYGQTQDFLKTLQDANQPFVTPDGTQYEVTDDFIKMQLDAIKANSPYLGKVLAQKPFANYTDSAQRLLNGDKYQAGEVRRMLDYYYSPDYQGEIPPAVAGIQEAVATFDYWKQQRDAIVGQTNDAKSRRSYFQQQLEYNLALVGAKDVNTQLFIDRVLTPLVSQTLYAPDANGNQAVPSAALMGR